MRRLLIPQARLTSVFASATKSEAIADSNVESFHTGPRLITNRTTRDIYSIMAHRDELGSAGIPLQSNGVFRKGRGVLLLTVSVAEGFSLADGRVLRISATFSARPE